MEKITEQQNQKREEVELGKKDVNSNELFVAKHI